MKKQAYIAPATKVQKIELHRILAGSGPQNVYSSPEDGISDESYVLSRKRSNLWDEEE